jgi:hypothetical protein
VNLITTYNPSLHGIQKLLSRHHTILLSDARLSKIFPEPPRLVYRRNKNLRDLLVRARIHNSQISENSNGCHPCGKLLCKVCKQMLNTDTVISKDGAFSFRILGNNHCQTPNVVYLLECKKCNCQYIGQTSTPFNLRFNNHKSHCRVLPGLAVSRHCAQEGHGFEQLTCVILRSGFSSDQERLCFESFLIQRFKTASIGMNEDIGNLPPLL